MTAGGPAPGGVTRALVVTAHPDDVDFGAGGTVASWTASGIEVAYCVCTSGDAGGFDDTPRARMAGLREDEQRAAAERLGVRDVVFLGYPDGRVSASIELRRDISRQIRRFRPERVLAPSPEIWWSRVGASHPDHRAVGEATLAAVYPDARNPFAHPELLEQEGLTAWEVRELWLMAAPEERRNHVVDITGTLPDKVAALRAHRTQTAHMTDLDERMRTSASATGRMHGLAEGRCAEVFQVVEL